MEEKIKNKKGAPKGNQYARKHGFYSKVLDEAQKRNLEVASNIDGIDEEIDILRVKIRNVLEKDPENIKLIMAAITTLANLLKTKVNLDKHQKKSFKDSLFKVIKEVAVPAGVNVISAAITKKM
jgi:uncharacterized protein YjcR